MKKWLFVALFALASFAPAQSATLTWTLQDVLFHDGGIATGSFGYDVDTNTFSAINITTSNSGSGLGATYGVPFGLGAANIFNATSANPPSRLVFYLASAMTNAGGTIAMLLDGSVEALCVLPCTTSSVFRFVSQGSITTSPVPLPAALPLFAAGLSAMGFMGWRRKRKALTN